MAPRGFLRFTRPSIAKRLVIWILLFSSVFALIVTVIQLYWDYRSEKALLEQGLEQVKVSFLPSIRDDLWYMDYDQVSSSIEGIRELPDILYVKVDPNEWIPIETGILTDERIIEREIPISIRTVQGEDYFLGNMTIIASMEGIYDRLEKKVVLVLVTQAIKTFLVAAFMFYLFNILIIRHLETIAKYARRMTIKESSPPLSLARTQTRTTRADELAQVVMALNKMKEELLHSYEELLSTNAELTDHKQNLEKLVEARTRELKKAERALLENAHRAGMAEIAVGVLHHIGNSLNSLNISSQFIESELDNSSLEKLLRANNLLESHRERLTDFIVSDPKGMHLIHYYLELGQILKSEHSRIHEEVVKIDKHIQDMRKTIASQQEYAQGSRYEDLVDLRDLVRETLGLDTMLTEKYGIQISRTLDKDIPKLWLPTTKIRFVLLHLVKNARDAVLVNERGKRKIHIEIDMPNTLQIALRVRDNGIGLAENEKVKIFKSGYTTKEGAQGFGLHASANAMTEMGGQLVVESQGLGQGATFTLLFPIKRAKNPGQNTNREKEKPSVNSE